MNVFFSGIGGIGMSALAMHLYEAGHTVSGSDRGQSIVTDDLEKAGIAISFHQDGSAFPAACNLLVYSEAIPDDAPERAIARNRGITERSYFQQLGEISRGTNLIGICGTHGKSSTTSMAGKVLMAAGCDPSIVVGTRMFELDGRNWRRGKTDLWVVEACEYRKSFHYLSPRIVLLTNADGDHFDAFASKEEYEQAFVDFLRLLPEDGCVIHHASDPVSARIVKAAGRKGIDADTQPMISLKTPGVHMQKNAQLVLALAELLGVDATTARDSLSGYAGSWRRMEEKGTTESGAVVIDDYAHHPVEIAATIAAIRGRYPDKRLICAFQPHTHDRTLKLWNEFASAFKGADTVILTGVYDARPATEHESVDMDALENVIAEKSETKVVRGATIEEATEIARGLLQKDDVLLSMGAGSIARLPELLLRR